MLTLHRLHSSTTTATSVVHSRKLNKTKQNPQTVLQNPFSVNKTTPQLHPLHILLLMPSTHTPSSSSTCQSAKLSRIFSFSVTASRIIGGGGGGGGGGGMFSAPFVLTFSLLLSVPILFLLVGPRIFPPTPLAAPISPSDELDDLSLFHRAAAASSFSRLASPNSKLKIAFLFLTNTDLYLSPLWDNFFKTAHSSLYNVYVHADPSANVTVPGGVFKDRFIDHAKRTYRASPTLISATRRLLATAVLDDPANAFFAVLSQYCIPLHSFKYVYSSLVDSRSFDLSSDSSSNTDHGVRIQYKSFIEIISKEPRLWKRYIARGRYSMMPEIPFEKFRVGSQFFVLTRRHVLTVIKDRRLWKKFKLPCYRDDECYPEEHYFPTLLSMVDENGCTHYTLTRVNWTGTKNGHPYTYKPDEISPQLIRDLRKSNYSSSYLFARKFSPDCLKPLLKIAHKVIFRD